MVFLNCSIFVVMFKTLFHTLFLIIFSSFISFSQEKDSILTIKYFDLFEKYEFSDNDLAEKYSDSALFYAIKSTDEEIIGRAYLYKGWRLEDQARFKESNQMFLRALEHFEKAEFKQGIADAYGNIGNSYYDLGNFELSLKHQLLSIEVNKEVLSNNPSEAEDYRAKRGISYAMHNTGSIYYELGMLDKALEIEKLSLQQEIDSGSKNGEAISYSMLGKVYKKMGYPKKAKNYFERALEIFQSDLVENEYGEAETLKEYATLSVEGVTKKEQDKMFKKALDFYILLGDKEEEARILLDFIDFRFNNLKKDSISNVLIRVNKIVVKYELSNLREDYYLMRARFDYTTESYKSAYNFLSNYVELENLADERYKTQDIILGGVKNQMEMKNFADSLQTQNKFNKEILEHNKELAKVQNIVYISILGFLIVAVSLGFYMSSNRKKKRMNAILSEKNELIKKQKGVVDEKNASISDSINYAKRLQSAILPTAAQVNQFLPDSFLLFKPKDVVSGDFHWFETKNNTVLIAAADCTGHGVPGAMVSVVCSNALNRVVNEFGIVAPSKILDKTRELVIETFAKSEENVVDGMDIAFCAIDLKTKKITFSGANNPIWIIRKNQNFTASEFDSVYQKSELVLLELKGDKQPVGFYTHQKEFTQTEIQLLEGDIVYLFTDGFADQFGGEKGKKFKYKPFKNTLIEINEMSMIEQEKELKSIFNSWKGDLDQVDDVCVIGFKL